jgi:hypothetical protein
MKFHESGLPPHKLVEEAFHFSFDNAMAKNKEALWNYNQSIGIIHTQNIMALEADKKAGVLSDDEFRMHKNALEKKRDDQFKRGPKLIAEELDRMFLAKRLLPAREIALHATNPTPEMISAVMLVDCIRSPFDYANIEKKFGAGVAGLIAELVHIDVYPSERGVNLAKASPDAKRAYLGLLISSLDQIVTQIERSAQETPMQRIMFPPGQEELLYSNAKLVWGNDAKLDARFVRAFNRASDAVASPFKIDLDAAGAPALVNEELVRKPPKPRSPSGPGGNGGLGGDVF